MRRVLRGSNWAAGRLPTVLAWAGLAGLFVYGATHGWRFGEPPEEKEKEKAARSGGESDADGPPFTPYPLDVPYDVPIMVTHDPKTCTACDRRMQCA